MSGSTSFKWPTGSLHPELVIDSTVLAKPIPDPTRDGGWIFVSWCIDKDLTTEYDFSQPVTGDLTLYAKWFRTVTWNLNGGAWAEGSSHPNQIQDGKPLAKPTPDPARDGYTFGGWYTNSGLTTVYDFSKNVSAAVTLYARWDRAVTWNLNDGEWVEGSLHPDQVQDGKPFAKPTPDPAKDGYTFGGWYTDSTFATAYDFTKPVAAVLTLYAKWNIVYRTITWTNNSNSATFPVLPKQVENNTVLSEPTPRPSGRSGYVFGAWCTDAALTTEYDFSKPVAGEPALDAR
jgi:uncharacterized repeat protein (TIGR02543 family)